MSGGITTKTEQRVQESPDVIPTPECVFVEVPNEDVIKLGVVEVPPNLGPFLCGINLFQFGPPYAADVEGFRRW
jgi:hypothetical protein